MNIQDLKSNTTWQEASNTINNNNNKISLAIATLENATLKNKGYFTTKEKLKAAIPNPTIGSKAYVGTSEPYAIYIVENGAWVDSGYTGGDEIVANITTDRIEDGAVTIDKLEPSIQSLITNISKNASFAGIATPSTNPGTPDGPVFYIALQAGLYPNFSGIEVKNGESVILQWNSSTWIKSSFKPMTDFNSVYDLDGNNLTKAFERLHAVARGTITVDELDTIFSSGIYLVTLYGESGESDPTSIGILEETCGVNNSFNQRLICSLKDPNTGYSFDSDDKNSRVWTRTYINKQQGTMGPIVGEWSLWECDNTITTDRIEDGAVTSEKIATSAFDDTLSVSGKIAPADVVGEKLAELGKTIDVVKLRPMLYSGYITTTGSVVEPYTGYFYSESVKVYKGDVIQITCLGSGQSNVCLYNGAGDITGGQSLADNVSGTVTVHVPNDGYIRISIYGEDYELYIKASKTIKDALTRSLDENRVIAEGFYKQTIRDLFISPYAILSTSALGGDADTYKHVMIKVKAGDTISIRTHVTQYFGFTKDISYEKDVVIPLVGGLDAISDDQENNRVVPSGAEYMLINVLGDGNDVSPYSIIINGYDIATSLQSKLFAMNQSLSDKINADKLEASNFYRNNMKSCLTLDGIVGSSGTIIGEDGYKHIVIKVQEGDDIIIKTRYTQYCGFTDKYDYPNDEVIPFIGGLSAVFADQTNSRPAPAGAKYLLLNILENGNDVSPYSIVVNGYDIATSIYDKLKKYIETTVYEYVVDVNGDGDFTSLRDCFAHIGREIDMAASFRPSSQPEWVDDWGRTYKEFNVKIMPGTYDVRSYYTSEEWNSRDVFGLLVPRGVNLIGMGKSRGDVIIDCTSETHDELKSTLNIQNDFACKNLTLKGNNVRYVVHDDYSHYPYANAFGDKREFVDVDLIGENLIYNTVYGAGTKGGADWKFINCRFVNKNSEFCFSVHDRDGNEDTKPEHVLLQECEFMQNSNKATVSLVPLTGLSSMDVSIVGCMLNKVRIQTTASTTKAFNIKGYGNSRDLAIEYTDESTGRASAPKFSDM